MKILVETTGSFMLVDFSQSGLEINADRPTVSNNNSSFVSSRAAIGQIRVLGNLTDEATDEEFKKYWDESKQDVVDGDVEKAENDRKVLAVSSFLGSYAVGGEPKAEEVKEEEQPKRTYNKKTS